MTFNNVTFSLAIAQDLVNKDDQFPVDLDLAWQWLGYATKQKAQNKLFGNFEQGLDYNLNQTVKVQIEGKRQVSRPYLQITLTIDCFKSLGMMAGTEQGKQIRKYFLQCEKVIKEIIPQQNQEIEKLKMQLELAKTQERLTENQTRLLATVQLLETISPGLAPLALGKADAVVERVEYVERVIDKSQDKVTEGVGITYLTKRFGFKNNGQTWQWLESIGYGKDSGKWENQLSAITTPKLPKNSLDDLTRKFKRGVRQQLLGE